MKTHIAGYKGFQTYGQLPYSTLKSGKDVLAPNNLWENSKNFSNFSKLFISKKARRQKGFFRELPLSVINL